MPASKVRELLAAEGCAPEPDDDTPTQPNLTTDACVMCKGEGKVVEDMPDGRYRVVKCPRCRGLCVDPGNDDA